jgi:hypothetical protein
MQSYVLMHVSVSERCCEIFIFVTNINRSRCPFGSPPETSRHALAVL